MRVRRYGGLALALALGIAARAEAGGVYLVKQGDTLYRIARSFGVDAGRLIDHNGLRSAHIKPGDRLRIPDRASAAGALAPTGVAPGRKVAESTALRGDSASSGRRLVCRADELRHTVAPGDTLFALARRYGTTVEDLLRLNGLARGSRLAIGRRLIVRSTAPRTHVVRQGDTLTRIATTQGVTVDALRKLNGLPDDRLAVGQRIALESCEQYALAGPGPAVPAAAVADHVALAEARAEAAVRARDAGLEAGTEPEGLSEQLIGFAKTMLDIPYRFGGTSLKGIDCSGYVQRVFSMLGMPLPRTAREQYTVGEVVDREGLSKGDLVFFRTYARFPSHVGIYLGDNLFIHASSMVRKVTIDSLEQPYYVQRFLGGRRLLEAAGTDTRLAAEGMP